MNSLVWIICDSCRYDSFQKALKPNIDRFCSFNQTSISRRYSYASWTAPSHHTFLMGMVPHSNPKRVVASDVYKVEFQNWTRRLGIEGLDFAKFVPHLSLPKVLRDMGYHTTGRVSLPVLNEFTLLASHFDDYRMMDDHNDFSGMIDEMAFPDARARFYFLNLGETHYPYMLKDNSLPRIAGVHGVYRNMDRPMEGGTHIEFFDESTMSRLRAQQAKCVEYIDSLLPRLFQKCPKGTHVIITADHGELFGEEDFFGHGPIIHEKVFEVPFVEGKVPV